MIIIIVALVVWGGCQVYNMLRQPDAQEVNADSVVMNTVTDSVVRQDLRRDAVKKKLVARANEQWPGDHVRQENWIREQMSDWEFMERLPADPVKEKIQKSWPSDYSLQRARYEEQLKAKKDIEQI